MKNVSDPLPSAGPGMVRSNLPGGRDLRFVSRARFQFLTKEEIVCWNRPVMPKQATPWPEVNLRVQLMSGLGCILRAYNTTPNMKTSNISKHPSGMDELQGAVDEVSQAAVPTNTFDASPHSTKNYL